mmetsp:Transcript_19415/g.53924  ORF Transcript_19415/g.53924 Transcript_19415/m.53924 type:complete len:201 (+) Transcript_19415:2501-3103(+)
MINSFGIRNVCLAELDAQTVCSIIGWTMPPLSSTHLFVLSTSLLKLSKVISCSIVGWARTHYSVALNQESQAAMSQEIIRLRSQVVHCIQIALPASSRPQLDAIRILLFSIQVELPAGAAVGQRNDCYEKGGGRPICLHLSGRTTPTVIICDLHFPTFIVIYFIWRKWPNCDQMCPVAVDVAVVGTRALVNRLWQMFVNY